MTLGCSVKTTPQSRVISFLGVQPESFRVDVGMAPCGLCFFGSPLWLMDPQRCCGYFYGNSEKTVGKSEQMCYYTY